MSVAGVCDRSRYTDSWSALLTPRISLVTAKLHVAGVGHCSNGHVQAGAACRVGTRGWCGQVGTGVGYYPATWSSLKIGIVRAQLMPGPHLLRPLWHSRPLLGPPHTIAPRTQHGPPACQYGRDSIKYILKLVESWSVTEIVA